MESDQSAETLTWYSGIIASGRIELLTLRQAARYRHHRNDFNQPGIFYGWVVVACAFTILDVKRGCFRRLSG